MNINKHREALMNIFNMMHSRVLNLFLCASFLLNFGSVLPIHSVVPDYTSAFTASMVAGGVGDALGRVTEFKSTEDFFKHYSHGVRSYGDFLPQDWVYVPDQLKNKKIAPYTDDTAMAKLVMKELIESREHDWDLNTTMSNIAQSFIKDAEDLQLGWIARFRAPGNACKAGVKKLRSNFLMDWDYKKHGSLGYTGPRPWDVLAHTAGGCGSVMRAHPFGLVFADNPEKAALWAAEHSRLTHGDPLALAACAAMATGVAYAVQGKDPDFIVGKMVKVAHQYDAVTANKIEMAYMAAQRAKELRKPFNDIFQAYDNAEFRQFNDHVFSTFLGFAAHDAVAATVYAFTLSPDNIMEAIYLGVHTPGDSDSIASMAGALVGARVGVEQLPKGLVMHLENSAELAFDAVRAANLFKTAQ